MDTSLHRLDAADGLGDGWVNSDPLFSENWFRIKDLKPRLAVDVGVRRHVYRRVPWYVLYRASTGTYHRVDARAFQLVGNLDGTVTVDALWKGAIESQGADAPTQANLMDLLAQLHEADLLTIDRRLNAEQLFQRRAKRTRADVKQRYLNPLYLRFPIFDPDRMLDWLAPLPRLLFSKPAYFGWVGLLLWAMTQLAPRTTQLYHEFAAFDFLSAVNGFTFFVVYPLIKMLHELAHGLAVKRYGGEVHELGLALMVLLPIPYVDASAAAIFPDKRHRMMVGAAGIMVELGVAAVAALIWSAGEPGQIHDVAFMIMMIGGISTVVFNGNPLLKFDGYYVLADALEIPNLAERSKQFVLGKLKHRLFGLEHAAIPAGD
ncbi:MAG: peptidase M50, partial [Gammaproteobacteria bacterium]|nr:peptidase M50 [Gammaproteobacteria bacterium]